MNHQTEKVSVNPQQKEQVLNSVIETNGLPLSGFVTKEKVAEYLDVSPRVVKERQGIDGFPVGIKISDKILRFDAADVHAYAASLKQKAIQLAQARSDTA